jgi:protein-tyrosine-phosphatase
VSQSSSIAAPQPGLMHRAITYVLTHPAAMRVKQPVRDLVWRVKGNGVENPAIGEGARSLLFVCLGNICRSPFAARACARVLAAHGVTDVTCESAGIRTTQAARSPQDACEAAARVGVSLDDHVPLQLTRELVEKFDVIVVMEAVQLESLRASYPEAANRIVLLPLFAGDHRGGYARYNIADPFGQPAAAFDACYERIREALTGLLHAAGWRQISRYR